MTGRAEFGDSASSDPDATAVLPADRSDASSTQPIPPASAGAGDRTVVLPPIPVPAGQVPEPGPGAEPDGAGAVARNSATMAVGSIVSRATGLLRTVAIGAAIGAEAVANDYETANTLPNMVYELLLGGVLTSVIVPLLVRARSRDADRGEAYAQRLLTLATVALAGATLLAVAAAPVLTMLVARTSGPDDQRLITLLAYLMLPQIFFYGVAAVIAAVLNTRGHFAAPMWTPILNNVVVIATAVLFMLLPATAGRPTPEAITATQILVLGVGTTLGIVVQAVGLWPALRGVGFRWRWRWDFRALHLGELARTGAWMLVYVLGSQVAVVALVWVAMIASSGGPGLRIYNLGFLIFMMAHGIVAVSIITALMPRISAAAANHRYADMAEQLSHGTRLSAVILVPATAGYVVLGRPLAVTLFEWGNVTRDNALDTGWVIAAAGLGLVPFAISQIQTFAFYALPDTRTPALANIPVVALRCAGYLAALLLPAGWVVAGLWGANTVSYLAALALGYWLLRRRIGPLGLMRVLDTLVRLGLAALIASVPAALVVVTMTALAGDAWASSVAQLVVGGSVLIAAYLAAALALRVREVRDLIDMIRARLGR